MYYFWYFDYTQENSYKGNLINAMNLIVIMNVLNLVIWLHTREFICRRKALYSTKTCDEPDCDYEIKASEIVKESKVVVFRNCVCANWMKVQIGI